MVVYKLGSVGALFDDTIGLPGLPGLCISGNR